MRISIPKFLLPQSFKNIRRPKKQRFFAIIPRRVSPTRIVWLETVTRNRSYGPKTYRKQNGRSW